ncbi:MAG: F0F1 ATP synthase subunit delta [Rhodobacteraceae bacterium]|nr:F0F1 ATP synthase subunit delta [Paracoccaceae bacterium]
MSEPASISAGIAGRYASAVFELSKEAKGLSALETDVSALTGALKESKELSGLISSPLFSREDQAKAMAALSQKMGLSPTMGNALALMASNRRLFVLPQLLTALKDMIAEDKGEVTAEVTAAAELTKAQADKLAASLSKSVGKTVKLNTTVDDSLIGGLIVKVGSKMIDTSIRSKLASLQNVMKEVG